MVHLILTGATGLVGSSVLLHILSLPATTSITRLSILSRSPVPLASSPNRTNTTTQIEVINHTDYATYSPELLEKLKDAKGIIWAQGISQTEVDKATYEKITKLWPLAAAQAFASAGIGPGNATPNASSSAKGDFNFIYVSGEGVTYHPGRFTRLFAQVKGEAELSLLALAHSHPNFNTIMARPAGVDGSAQPEIWQPILARRSMAFKAMMHVLLPVFRVGYKNMISPTKELGKVLTELAMREEPGPLKGEGVEDEKGGRGEGWVLRNVALRRMGGLAI